jgi:hypothetical protein
MLRRLHGRKVSGQMQKRTQVMPAMGRRTGKDGKRQMVGWGLNAFIVIALLCVLMVQMITATAMMEEIHKLRGEQGMIWEKQKKILLKQLDTIKTTGDIQNQQLKVVLEQLVKRIEQEKKVTEYYEKIEEITQLTLDHANAVEKENERLRRETGVIAQAAAELQEENKRFREGSNGDEI